MSAGSAEAQWETWVVDRIVDGLAILVDEVDEIVVEVAADLLGDHAVEGAVLSVPLGSVGEPVWQDAERDTGEEEARRSEAEATLDELKRRDPGGDIEL